MVGRLMPDAVAGSALVKMQGTTDDTLSPTRPQRGVEVASRLVMIALSLGIRFGGNLHEARADPSHSTCRTVKAAHCRPIHRAASA